MFSVKTMKFVTAFPAQDSLVYLQLLTLYLSKFIKAEIQFPYGYLSIHKRLDADPF